jgi:hypothetical protein
MLRTAVADLDAADPAARRPSCPPTILLSRHSPLAPTPHLNPVPAVAGTCAETP